MHRSSTHHRFVSPRRRGFSWGLALWLGLWGTALLPHAARADGCYSCGGGSSDACKDYCRYTGNDTFEARKSCERKGCRVSGTAACPGAGAKICLSPKVRVPDGASDQTIAWCAAPPPRSAS